MIDRIASRANVVESGDLPIWVRYGEAIIRAMVESDERSAQYALGLDAFSDEERTFPSIALCERILEDGWDVEELKRWPSGAGMDLAGEASKGTWIVVTHRRPSDGRKIVTEDSVYRGAWNTWKKLAAMDRAFREHRIESFAVEDNAFQRMLVEVPSMMGATMPWWDRLWGHTTGNNKWDRAIGLPTLEQQFLNGGWEFWYRSKHKPGCGCNLCVLIGQFKDYVPAEVLKFDAVMATWKSEFAVRKMTGQPADLATRDISEDRMKQLIADERAREAQVLAEEMAKAGLAVETVDDDERGWSEIG